MRNAHGTAIITDRETGKQQFMDTMVCRHCQRITHVKPKQSPSELGGFCAVCSGLICSGCVGKGCDEIQRKLDRQEASYHARRSYGI